MKNDDYKDSIDEAVENTLDFVLMDIMDSLEKIEEKVETESNRILLMWVQDIVSRTVKNYKR